MTSPSLTLGDLSSKIRHVETVLAPGYTARLSMIFANDFWVMTATLFNPDTGSGLIYEGVGLWLDIAARALFNRLDHLTTKDFPR
jgi:hypothetical protein